MFSRRFIRGLVRLAIATSMLIGAAAVPVKLAHAQGSAAEIYEEKCAGCHGDDGTPTPTGKALGVRSFGSLDMSKKENDRLAAAIIKGRNRMLAYGNDLKESTVNDLVAYIRELGSKKK